MFYVFHIFVVECGQVTAHGRVDALAGLTFFLVRDVGGHTHMALLAFWFYWLFGFNGFVGSLALLAGSLALLAFWLFGSALLH